MNYKANVVIILYNLNAYFLFCLEIKFCKSFLRSSSPGQSPFLTRLVKKSEGMALYLDYRLFSSPSALFQESFAMKYARTKHTAV